MRAQDFVVFAQNDFGEAIGLADPHRLAIGGPGEAFDTGIGILFLCLRLGQANEGDLGEGIDGIGDDVVVHLCAVSHRIIAGDLSLHRGDVRKTRAVYKVADGIDAGQVRLHLLIDAHAPPVVIQSLLHQLFEAAGIGAATHRHQHIFAAKSLLALVAAGDNFFLLASSSIASTFVLVTISMPRLVSVRTSRRRTSSSNGASTFGSISTTVTLEPSALNMQASSMPITPPPTQIMLSGSFGRFQQVSLLMTLRPSMPGKGGMSGTEPVARMIFSALNCCVEPSFAVTVTLREASTVASPSNTSTLLPFISTPTPLTMRLTTLSLNATAFAISKVGGFSR